jgi:hypothetical protein
VGTQGVDHRGRQLNGPPRRSRLGREQLELTVDSLKRLHDLQGLGLEVDVLPLQTSAN